MTNEQADRSDTSRNPVNARLRRALDQYLTLDHPPGFAVLLNGPWGVGKSHLVREVIEDAAGCGRRILIVSLYGLSTRAEIDAALAAARWPWVVEQPHRAGPAHGDPVRAHPSAPFHPPRIHGRDAEAFVFDDLERCGMSPTDALGYINQYVERDGAKVVVIAHRTVAAERCDEGAFDAAAEKVIGRTLVVKPEFSAAFAAFVERIKSPEAREHMRGVEADIAALHEQSRTDNLRILQHALWDFERIYLALRPEHRAQPAAMAELLRAFFALAFEFKAGRLGASELENRFAGLYGGLFGNGRTPSRLQASSLRYPGVPLQSLVLSDEVLRDLLADGLIDPELVQRDLDRSSWFASEEEPSWRTVWYSDERSQSDVLAAATKLFSEFEERTYTRAGEMLHVFGQMLKLADLGVGEWTRDRTILECRRYIDDLRAAGTLEPPDEERIGSIRDRSYDGLGFEQRDAEAFAGIFAYLDEQRQRAAEDRYEEQAAELLALLKADTTAFVRQIAYHQGAAAPFSRAPVLARLDPHAFVDALIDLPPLEFREALLGISGRYDMGAFSRELGPERAWAEAVGQAIAERIAGLDPVTRDRTERIVSGTLGKILSDIQQSDPEPKVDQAGG